METSFIVWNIGKTNDTYLQPKIESLFLEERKIDKSKTFDLIIFIEAENFIGKDFCVKNKYTQLNIKTAEKTLDNIKIFSKNKSKFNLSALGATEFADSILEIEVPNLSLTFSDVLTSTYLKKQIVSIKQYFSEVSLQMIKIESKDFKKVLLSIIHFPSKLYGDETDWYDKAITYKEKIQAIASDFDDRSIIMGDFNSLPFETVLTGTKGFHALSNKNKVSDTTVQRNLSKSIQYYNPCWNLLGDYSYKRKRDKASGTFYYAKSREPKKMDYHLFDQMIMTKKMVNEFVPSDLEILHTDDLIKEVETSAQLRKGKKILDHLPIFFTFDFKK